MFLVFGQQLFRQFRCCQDVSAVVIDVFLIHRSMTLGALLSMLNAKSLTSACQRVASVRQCKCKRAQIQKVTAKDITTLRFAGAGAFRNQIDRIGTLPGSEALQSTL